MTQMETQQESTQQAGQWWREWQVGEDQTLVVTLGPLALRLYHGTGEWQFGWSWQDEVEAGNHVQLDYLDGPPDEEPQERYVVSGQAGRLRLRPVLLDRPVVIRPRTPIFLPSGEETTIYLSSPLCLRIELGEPGVLLKELPMLRLSDTWFGPSTREGELCYSGRTHARHSIAELPNRPHRAITPLRVRNQAESVLPLEKFSLPVPALSVYGDSDGSLWTESVSLLRVSDNDLASLRIDKGAPRYAPKATQISEARQPVERGSLIRAFSVLFGD